MRNFIIYFFIGLGTVSCVNGVMLFGWLYVLKWAALGAIGGGAIGLASVMLEDHLARPV